MVGSRPYLQTLDKAEKCFECGLDLLTSHGMIYDRKMT
jgi:hypothetical protein